MLCRSPRSLLPRIILTRNLFPHGLIHGATRYADEATVGHSVGRIACCVRTARSVIPRIIGPFITGWIQIAITERCVWISDNAVLQLHWETWMRMSCVLGLEWRAHRIRDKVLLHYMWHDHKRRWSHVWSLSSRIRHHWVRCWRALQIHWIRLAWGRGWPWSRRWMMRFTGSGCG